MLEQVVPAEPLEHALAHLVGGLDVERDPGDRADRAEADHEPVELGIATRRANQAAVRGDDLERGDGRRQVAVGVPRPVSRGRHGAGNRDVRQRRQVCERQPLASELEREFAVAHGASARHGHGLGDPRRTSGANASSVTSSAESAMSVNEWREPRTRTCGAAATISRTCSSVDGAWTARAR